MEFLSEDPTYLAGTLGILGGAFLILLRLTQQGKYIVWAVTALALALLVLVIERLWVTDNERLERVVYSLARGVETANVPTVFANLAPDVQYVARSGSLAPPETRRLIEGAVANARFDFLRITQLRVNAGGQSRRGTAEFQVIASGSVEGPFNTLNFGTANSSWSLGFRETSPKVWKVSRITPVRLPSGAEVILPARNDLRAAARAQREEREKASSAPLPTGPAGRGSTGPRPLSPRQP
jgi:hypothetical protein